MPNTNALLLLGLGLAALTMFRRDESEANAEDLVNASMLSSDTGRTGQALSDMHTVQSTNPIGFTPTRAPISDLDINLRNVPTGPIPEVSVTPFVQTPEYIRTTGEFAGTSVRQLGISTAGSVDLINPKIFVQEISVNDPDEPEEPGPPRTMSEEVHIVAGGANPGDPYMTTLDVLAAARDQGWFDPPEKNLPNEAGFIVGASNVFDVAAYNAYEASIVEPVTPTGGVPVFIAGPAFESGQMTGGAGTGYGIDIWGDEG